MKRKFVGVTAIALLILSGCSTDEQPEAALETQPPIESTSAGEEEAPTVEEEPLEEETSPEPEPEEETPEPEQTFSPREVSAIPDTDPTFTDRGNVLKEIGESAFMTNANGEIIFVEINIMEAVADFECSAQDAVPPLNGSYLGLHFEIITTTALAESDDTVISINPDQFSVWDDSGKRVNDPIGHAYSCLASNIALPSTIGPSEYVTGWLALDVPSTSGAFSFGFSTAAGGWEWNY